jgi:hypothetical protein
MADRRFRGKADMLRSGPVYGRLAVCYPFGRKHAREPHVRLAGAPIVELALP